MMAGNPNWWSMNGMHPQSQFIYGSSNSPNPSPPPDLPHPNQDFPVRSWSQLLLGGNGIGGGEEERYGASLFQQQKKVDNWEDQVLNSSFARILPSAVVGGHGHGEVKQESSHINYNNVEEEHHHHHFPTSDHSWPRHHHPPLSPNSCVTTLSNSILNFSSSSSSAAAAERKNQQHNQDHSSECNSTSTGGVSKKARVQQSSAQPALKVRKEKLGDRITALHQLVSPFGKTDTASVLSEAIGYIRFLQGQIEALSSPYMRNAAHQQQQHSVNKFKKGIVCFPKSLLSS